MTYSGSAVRIYDRAGCPVETVDSTSIRGGSIVQRRLGGPVRASFHLSGSSNE